MATSAGGTTGGSALIPIIAAIGIGGPAALAMSLAFSDSDAPTATRAVLASLMERNDRNSPQSFSASGISGGGGSSPRLDLFGSSAIPAPRLDGNAGVQIAQLPEEASPQQQADAAAGELAAIEPSAGPLGRMAGLQSGGGSVGGVQGGGAQGGGSHASGGGNFGGSFGGFGGGGGGSSGFAGGGAGAPAGPAPSSAAAPSSNPASQPSMASVTPPPAPQVQPPAPPAATPPASGPIPIVLTDPNKPFKGSGPMGDVVLDGGRLAAGNSPGIQEYSSLVLSSGVIEVEFESLNNYDRYVISGIANFGTGEIDFEFIFYEDMPLIGAFDRTFLTADAIVGFDDATDLRFYRRNGADFIQLSDDLFDVRVVNGEGGAGLALFFLPIALQQSNDQQGRVAQAPEPEALFLFGLGLLGLAAARRRLA